MLPLLIFLYSVRNFWYNDTFNVSKNKSGNKKNLDVKNYPKLQKKSLLLLYLTIISI